MKTKKLFAVTYLIVCMAMNVDAQMETSSPRRFLDEENDAVGATTIARNIIKLNVTALVLKNYAFQYERVLNKTVSVAVSFRTMPTTSIPFQKAILESIGDDDPDSREVIEKLRLSNFAFTPEVRFYIGRKGYGRGFYFAPFYRYASFKTNDLIINYDNTANIQSSLGFSGKLTANTGGLMIGAQWALGKYLSLDWWILGSHYGAGNGTFTGVPDRPLTPDEQSSLRQELEDLDIPLTDKTVSVTANSASLKLDGPWAGVRAGLCLGVRF